MAVGACHLITKLKWEDPGALEISLSFYEQAMKARKLRLGREVQREINEFADEF